MPENVMRWLWIFAWTYLVFVLQTAFVREMQIAGCVPHLVLTGLVLLTIRFPGRAGLFLAAGWGLLSDCVASGPLGTDIVTFILAAYAIRQFAPRSKLHSPARAGALAGLIVFAVLVVSTSLRMLADGRTPDLPALARYAAGSAIYSGAVVAAASLAARLVLRSPTGNDSAAPPAVSNKWRMLTE
ncbi:MAG: rod shape-determining protein MreD [Deltaproteobacteria bacterium]